MKTDQRKINELRVLHIACLMDKTPVHEAALREELRPLLGELLALASAALRVRDSYCQMPDHSLQSVLRLGSTSVGVMMSLDMLEAAARETEGQSGL
jgi:hypothetical protein